MVQIITDSASDFEPYELEKMDILCVPITVYFGNEEYKENINLTKQQFYKLIEKNIGFPNTSQTAPHAFESVMKKIKDRGDEAVVITLSSALSGTCQSAILARNNLEYEKCYVVDSLTASAGERILVEYAVKLRSEGKSAEEIAACLEVLRPRIVLYACIDTLDYLYKGGRMSHSAYKIASAAHIKPIIHMLKDGSVELAAKPLGIKRGMEYLRKRLEIFLPDKEFPCYVMYTCNKKSGQDLAEYFEKRAFAIPEDHIKNVGAAVGSHIGPNSFGIAYVKSAQNI